MLILLFFLQNIPSKVIYFDFTTLKSKSSAISSVTPPKLCYNSGKENAMATPIDQLLFEMRQTEPEVVYSRFLTETNPVQKDFLKSLYDALLKARQQEVINSPDFVR